MVSNGHCDPTLQMKIVHVIPSMQVGGPQIILSDLLPALVERGADVSLLVYDECHSRHEHRLMNEGVKVLSMGCRNKYNPRVIPTLHAELARANVAHIHLAPAIWQGALASLGLGTPLVCTIHNHKIDRSWMRPMRKWALGRYAAIVSPTDALTRGVETWLGTDRERIPKIVTIPHCVRMERLRNTRRAPGFGTEHRVITMISKFDHSKDQRTLIRAIPLLTDPTVVVAFIGEGPTLEAHREYARVLGVADRVKFLGMRDDIPSLIAGTTIGVQSSHREVFALSALEFMGLGKPVIGSDIPSIRNIIGHAGLLFPPGHEMTLAAQINQLLDDPVYYREVSEACLARSNEFSVDLMADRYFSLYQELTGK